MPNESTTTMPAEVVDGTAGVLPGDLAEASVPGYEVFARNAAELPDNPESPEFIHRLQELKSSYPNRTSFNFMVCDELARRKIAPNGSAVLRIGRWGSSGNVHGDVTEWYAALARSLDKQHAKIPPQARASANALFEQLWALASQQTLAPYQQRIDVLSARLANAEAAQAEASERANRMERELATLTTAHQDALAQIASLQEAVEAQKRLHDAAKLEWERASADQVEAAAQRLADERAVAQRREDELLARAHEVQRQHAEDARGYREALTRLSDEVASVRIDAAQQVDRARQDAKEANSRANTAESRAGHARAVEAALRDQIASVAVEGARMEMAMAAKDVQIQELLAKIAELQSVIAQQGSAPQTARRGQKRR